MRFCSTKIVANAGTASQRGGARVRASGGSSCPTLRRSACSEVTGRALAVRGEARPFLLPTGASGQCYAFGSVNARRSASNTSGSSASRNRSAASTGSANMRRSRSRSSRSCTSTETVIDILLARVCYFFSLAKLLDGGLVLFIRYSARTTGRGHIYLTSASHPRTGVPRTKSASKGRGPF